MNNSSVAKMGLERCIRDEGSDGIVPRCSKLSIAYFVRWSLSRVSPECIAEVLDRRKSTGSKRGGMIKEDMDFLGENIDVLCYASCTMLFIHKAGSRYERRCGARCAGMHAAVSEGQIGLGGTWGH